MEKKREPNNPNGNRLPKCYWNRKLVATGEVDVYQDFVEYSSVKDFLLDYFLLQPTPFQELQSTSVFGLNGIKAEECQILSRKGQCKSCHFRVDNTEYRTSEKCTEAEKKEYESGYAVHVNLPDHTETRKVTIEGEDYYLGTRATDREPLTLHDVRLKGRPGRLVVDNRQDWYIKGKTRRIPLEILPGIVLNKKETMTLRLMCAINETYVACGTRPKLIAEGYGVSKDLVTRHITRSANIMREKTGVMRDEALFERIRELDLKGQALLERTVATFLAGEEFVIVFECSAKNPKKKVLVDCFPKSKITDFLAHQQTVVESELNTHDFGYMWEREFVQNFVEFTRYSYAVRERRGDIPPEISFLIGALWKELWQILEGFKVDQGPDIAEEYKRYVLSACGPLIRMIIADNQHIELPELERLKTRLSNLGLGDKPRYITILSALQMCVAEWRGALIAERNEAGEALRLWENNYAAKATDEQNAEVDEFVKRLENAIARMCDDSAEEITLQDIINSIWINQVSLPRTNMPDGGFAQTVFGLVDASELTEYGIPIDCLKRLLKTGLFSSDPHQRPRCERYKDQILNPAEVCRECMLGEQEGFSVSN